MVWTWSSSKLEAFIKKAVLHQINKFYGKVKANILAEVKDMVKDEAKLQVNTLNMRADVATSIREEMSGIILEIAKSVSDLSAEIASIHEEASAAYAFDKGLEKRLQDVEAAVKELDLGYDAVAEVIIQKLSTVELRVDNLETEFRKHEQLQAYGEGKFTIPRRVKPFKLPQWMIDRESVPLGNVEGIAKLRLGAEDVNEPAEGIPFGLAGAVTGADLIAMTPEQRERLRARIGTVKASRGAADEEVISEENPILMAALRKLGMVK